LAKRQITRIQELVYVLRVGDVMKKEVIEVAPSTPMGELRAVLRDNRISGAPVVEDGQLVGIISIEDFIGWLADGGPDCAIADRMTRNVISICEDEPVVQAVNKLKPFGFGRLPVINRHNHRLVGIITNGALIAGMLRKLDIDYRKAEMRNARSRHIFEDIDADRSALVFEYKVSGSTDLSRAGASAGGLKTTLLRLGMSPQTARRAAVAAYEAEMNLIFFAGGGLITARIEADTIRLQVEDQGPGIPDIAQAMRPGFSTAPDWVRELGFGAGMGLHNIQNCADRMSLTSTVGKGTRLEVDIQVERESEPAGDITET